MTSFRANACCLGLATALILVAGCTPPPGVGDETQGERYFNAAKSRTQRQDFTGAVAAYEQALQADPQMARAHYEMAMLFDKELNAPVKALYHYVRALELDPNFQGADLISNRLSEVKMRVAGDSLPSIASPVLAKEIDRLQGELESARSENTQLKAANLNLGQQLAALQHQPVPVSDPNPPKTPEPDNQKYAQSQKPKTPEPYTPPDNPSVPADRPRAYVVQRGDTLYGLSRRFNVSVDELKAANPGASALNFQAGRTINIPVK